MNRYINKMSKTNKKPNGGSKRISKPKSSKDKEKNIVKYDSVSKKPIKKVKSNKTIITIGYDNVSEEPIKKQKSKKTSKTVEYDSVSEEESDKKVKNPKSKKTSNTIEYDSVSEEESAKKVKKAKSNKTSKTVEYDSVSEEESDKKVKKPKSNKTTKTVEYDSVSEEESDKKVKKVKQIKNTKPNRSGSKTVKKPKSNKSTKKRSEKWEAHPIELYKDKYMLSNYGRIKSVSTENILKENIRSGYKSCQYSNNGTKRHYRTHRLVAILFVPNKDPKKNKIVNHIDGNKLNNYYKNLEWTTTSKNTTHAFETGLTNVSMRKVQCYWS